MKHIKSFENIKNEPKVGDYAIFDCPMPYDIKMNNLYNYTVHKIINIYWDSYETNLGLNINKSYLLDFSENKRKLQQFVKAKKITDKFNI
jgi:hypothetical protein